MRPGRLFWKIFLAIWLTQIIASVGVSAYFWWERQLRHYEHYARWSPPPPPPPGMPDGPPPHPSDAGPPHFAPPPPPPGLHIPWPLAVSALLASLAAASVLAYYLSRPIRSLQRALTAAGSGELSLRPGAEMGARQDELADLARDYDHMAERLRGLMEGQRRLLHDVSHELRSPLARMQAALDLARQQPLQSEAMLGRIERETGRMDMLIGELLTISRLEAGVGGVEEEIELAELLLAVVEDVRFEWADKPVSLHMPVLPEVLVWGDGQLLHRAIENVVRNAVKYSPNGGRINLDVQVEQVAGTGWCQLTVCDQGPGVVEADLVQIFEPFFRSKGDTSVEGYGLGLALARRIVQHLGGEIVARNGLEEGLCVSIRLPVFQPENKA